MNNNLALVKWRMEGKEIGSRYRRLREVNIELTGARGSSKGKHVGLALDTCLLLDDVDEDPVAAAVLRRPGARRVEAVVASAAAATAAAQAASAAASISEVV